MALSPGEQALVAKGQPVTSSFIPAASRARINAAIASGQGGSSSAPSTSAPAVAPPVSVSTPSGTAPAATGGMLTSSTGSGTPDIITRNAINMPAFDSTTESTTNTRGLIESIYQDELGRALGSKDDDKGALDYWTSRLQSGATPEQIRAEIEGTPEGTVFDAYTGLLGRAPDTEGSQYWQQQLTTGALTPEQVRTAFTKSPEFTQSFDERKTTDPLTLMESAQTTGSIADLGTLFYNARQADTQLPAELMQNLAETRTTDPTLGYEFLIGAQAYSEGLEALDQAIASGDQQQAADLRNALENEESYYNYYLQNIAQDDDQQHRNLRNETLTGSVFGIGDPKGGVKGSIERGISRLGDAIGDVAENPFVQAAVTFVNPAMGAVVNAYGTLDSGDNLSPAQIAATLAGVSELSGLEGGNLLKQLPQGVQDFVQSARDFANGAEARAVAALKRAFPNVDTDKLAQFEDDVKLFLAGIEDSGRNIIGDENINKVEQFFSGPGGGGPGGGVIPREQEEIVNYYELAGDGFTPKRGRQGGLAVDTEFLYEEPSLALAILEGRA